MSIDRPKKPQDALENSGNKIILWVYDWTVDGLSNTLGFDVEEEERELLITILQIWKNNIDLEDEEPYEGWEWESKKIDELVDILSNRNNRKNDIHFKSKFDLIKTIFTTLNNHLNTTDFKIAEWKRTELKHVFMSYINAYSESFYEDEDFDEIMNMIMQKIQYGEWLQNINSEF